MWSIPTKSSGVKFLPWLLRHWANRGPIWALPRLDLAGQTSPIIAGKSTRSAGCRSSNAHA
jgi:hypothetical protein